MSKYTVLVHGNFSYAERKEVKWRSVGWIETPFETIHAATTALLKVKRSKNIQRHTSIQYIYENTQANIRTCSQMNHTKWDGTKM